MGWLWANLLKEERVDVIRGLLADESVESVPCKEQCDDVAKLDANALCKLKMVSLIAMPGVGETIK